jgi:hypothetical protein
VLSLTREQIQPEKKLILAIDTYMDTVPEPACGPADGGDAGPGCPGTLAGGEGFRPLARTREKYVGAAGRDQVLCAHPDSDCPRRA